ncbi:MAG: hypothetical protein KC441_15680, partial [Anaerolineales bacterium]|nr:hypothetical protein [Anaerolineales bacterium]
MNSDFIPFQLEQAQQDGGSWDYRPWGTRSLKIRLATTQDLGPLRLRWPGAIQKAGLVCAYVGAGSEFVISWGGGHDPDVPVRTEDKWGAFEEIAPVLAGAEPNFLYFNVTHSGEALPESVPLTVEAYPDGGGTAVATLTLHLQRPAELPKRVIRLLPVTAGQRWEASEGEFLPLYDCRWWPARTVTYEKAERPPLAVQREGEQLLVQWAGQTVARIVDQTRPLVLDQLDDVKFELFQFITPAREYLALRVWFFWLNKEIKVLSLGGLGRHEVPDAERFDLLLRKKDGLVTLACTDLHWREMWGQVIEPPLVATIGLNLQQKAELGEEKLGSVFKKAAKDARRDYNPIGYIERLAEDLAQDDEELITRAKGTEAHVPMLNNVQQVTAGPDGQTIVVTKGTSTEHEMTSSDV